MEQWDSIYKNNAPKLLGVCRRYIRDESLAEDLMHNAFIVAMDKVHTYSGSGSFEGWLRRIVVNTVLLHIRKNKSISFSESEVLENISEAQEEESVEETERWIIERANLSKQELLNVIDLLPEHHKIVFNLYVIDEYKHKEIGEMLNISAGTSKSHLARARKKIQKLLLEKAQQKKEEPNKKRVLFFLFMPNKNYIDELYKNAFDSFEIKPAKEFQLDNKQSVVNTSNLSVLRKIWMNKVLFVSLVVGALFIITIFVFFIMSEDTSENQQKQEVSPEQQIIQTPVFDTDSASAKTEISIKIKKEGEKAAVPLKISKVRKKTDSAVVHEPVVLHKSIIKHDTIVQHKNIIQKVSANDEK